MISWVCFATLCFDGWLCPVQASGAEDGDHLHQETDRLSSVMRVTLGLVREMTCRNAVDHIVWVGSTVVVYFEVIATTTNSKVFVFSVHVC